MTIQPRFLLRAGLFLSLGAIFFSLYPEVFASLNGRKIGIDPGHSDGENMGVVISEGTWVRLASLRARTHLENRGPEVVIAQTSPSGGSIAQRQSILNSPNMHLMISMQSNAASPAAAGMEA